MPFSSSSSPDPPPRASVGVVRPDEPTGTRSIGPGPGRRAPTLETQGRYSGRTGGQHPDACTPVGRREHRLTADKIMGEVRALFPGNRAKQDSVFPDVQGPAPAKDEEPVAEPPAPVG